MEITDEDATRVYLAVLLSNPETRKFTQTTHAIYHILKKLTEEELDILYEGFKRYENHE